MPRKAKDKPAGPKVKVEGTISDGEGGFLPKGAELPEGCDVDSLKAKGLVD